MPSRYARGMPRISFRLSSLRAFITAYIGYALLMPWALRIGVDIRYHPDSVAAILRTFPHELFAEGHNLFLVALINAIPYVAAAVLTSWLVPRSPAVSAADRCARKFGLVLMLTFVAGFTTWMQLAVWESTFAPGHVSSTASLGLVFGPIMALMGLPLAFAVGWLIGCLWAWVRTAATRSRS